MSPGAVRAEKFSNGFTSRKCLNFVLDQVLFVSSVTSITYINTLISILVSVSQLWVSSGNLNKMDKFKIVILYKKTYLETTFTL
jgi:hypothetical protein